MMEKIQATACEKIRLSWKADLPTILVYANGCLYQAFELQCIAATGNFVGATERYFDKRSKSFSYLMIFSGGDKRMVLTHWKQPPPGGTGHCR